MSNSIKPHNIGHWIVQRSSILASVTIIVTSFSGFIVFFGGKVPPWPTQKEMSDLKLTVEILRSQVDGLNAFNDFQKCEDWNRRLRTAMARLKLAPGNPVEEDIINMARREIQFIMRCQIQQ